MATAAFVQDGSSIDYTPAADATAIVVDGRGHGRDEWGRTALLCALDRCSLGRSVAAAQHKSTIASYIMHSAR